MHRFIIILFYCGCISLTHAQIATVAGGKGAGMSNTSTTFQDIFSMASNQAGIAFLKNPSIGLIAEQRFSNQDIRQVGILAGMPSQFGSFGMLIQSFGFETYNEQKIGLAYARKLSKNFAIGLQFDYLNTRITEYGNQGTVTFEGGLQAQIIENLWLGASIFNPIRMKIMPDEYLPTQFNFGFSYRFSDKILLATEVQKDFEYPAAAKFGLDYRIIEALSIRLGVGTAPVQNSFGIGLHLQQFHFDFAANYHQILGITPTFSMNYDFKK